MINTINVGTKRFEVIMCSYISVIIIIMHYGRGWFGLGQTRS